MRKNMYKLSQKLNPTNGIDYINKDINNVKINHLLEINSKQINLQAINVEVKDYGFKVNCIPTDVNFDVESALNYLDYEISRVFNGRVYTLGSTDNGYTFNIILNELKDIKSLKKLKLNYINRYPYNIILGYTEEGEPFVIDLIEKPHIMVTGMTGTGKTRLVWLILTLLITSFNPDEFDFVIIKVAKDEFSMFDKCKNCKKVLDIDDMDELEKFLDERDKEIEEIEKKFKENNCVNIKSYLRKYSKYTKQIKPLFIIIDEFSFLNDLKNDKNSTATSKKIIKAIEKIIKKGRSNCTNIFAMLQRATYDQMSTTIRSQVTRVTLKQQDYDSGVAAIGQAAAKRSTKLKRQEALVSDDSEAKTLFIPNIDENIIVETIGMEKLYAKELTELTEKELINKYKNYNDLKFIPLTCQDEKEIIEALNFTNEKTVDKVGNKLKWDEKKKREIKVQIKELQRKGEKQYA